MSEALFSSHAPGVIPASVEDLSKQCEKLFKDRSRLQAQNAILKKEVNQRRASDVALQANVKEKEKELRKLQEQLDLLAFHNERLTKRIQAVQDSDQKGTHYSLLGGSVKKELERNAQALDEANMDLERKIMENEDLHELLNERQLEFTESINSLLKQIQDLEKRAAELQDENSTLQSEYKPPETAQSDTTNTDPSTRIAKEVTELDAEKHEKLNKEIETLKVQVQEKQKLLEEKEQQAKNNDEDLLKEIDSLRAILLAKVGDLNKNRDATLYEAIAPTALKSLREIEDQTKEYITALGNHEKPLKALPFEIAEQLCISTNTYSQELLQLVHQLEDTKNELNKLMIEKNTQPSTDKQIEKVTDVHNARVKELEQRLKEEEVKVLDLLSKEKNISEKVIELQQINTRLEQENKKMQGDIEQQKLSHDSALNELKESLEKEKNNSKDKSEKLDKRIQDESVLKIEQENIKPEAEKEEEEEVFIYPVKEEEKTEEKPEQDVSDENQSEEEVFVYRGMDAIQESAEADKQGSTTDSKKYDEANASAREEKLKAFYEPQMDRLKKAIQMTDSKALRFATMYRTMKDKLVKEDIEKNAMASEIERLKKEIEKLKDSLTTTESNYQQQVDSMTEFISSFQSNTEEQHSQQQRQHQQRRSSNNSHYSNNSNSQRH